MMLRAISVRSRVAVWLGLGIVTLSGWVSHTLAQQSAELKQELQSLAPDTCWLYSAWDSSHECRADSANRAERLLAEPQVRAFIDDIVRRLNDLAPQLLADASAVKRRQVRNITRSVLDAFFRRGGCLYLEHVAMSDADAPPTVHGAVWLDVGSSAPDVVRDILALIDQASGDRQQTLDGHSFYHISVDEEYDPDLWIGAVDSYVVAALGWERLGRAMERRRTGSTASWLRDLQARRPLVRTTGVSYLDVAKIRETFAPMGGAELQTILHTLGLDQLAAIETHSGFSETEMVNWSSLRLSGPPRGLFALTGNAGITAQDLKQVPTDALFAVGGSLDAHKVLELIENLMQQLDPHSAEEMAQGFESFRRETGVDLERDILQNLGSTWMVYNGAADGWLTGLVVTADVADTAKLNTAIDRLVSLFQRETANVIDAPQVIRQPWGDATVYALRFRGIPMPIEPCWCTAQGRLIVTFFPSTMQSALGQVAYEPLLDAQKFENLLRSSSGTGQRKLIGFSYSDTQRQFEFLYPYAQMLASMGQSMMQEMGGRYDPEMEAMGSFFEGLQLPPARVIHRHLQPSWALLVQHDGGIDFESRQTYPSVDLAVAVPLGIALTLPAVQQVREAANRTASMNNMRQIVIAAHNFHDAMGAFPAAYSTDAEGRPLLSWRVHLLPYLEANHLYEQFRLDEPWDSDHNIRLLEQMPAVFQSPAANARPGLTVYRGIGGPRGVLIPSDRLNRNTGRTLASIPDGTSNTLFLMETSDFAAVPWTQPDTEILPDEFDFYSLFGNYPGGTNVMFCDGSGLFLPISIPEQSLKFLMMVDDGTWVDMDYLWNR